MLGRFRSFQSNTISLCSSKRCKVVVCQTLKVIPLSGTITWAACVWFHSGESFLISLLTDRITLCLLVLFCQFAVSSTFSLDKAQYNLVENAQPNSKSTVTSTSTSTTFTVSSTISTSSTLSSEGTMIFNLKIHRFKM